LDYPLPKRDTGAKNRGQESDGRPAKLFGQTLRGCVGLSGHNSSAYFCVRVANVGQTANETRGVEPEQYWVHQGLCALLKKINGIFNLYHNIVTDHILAHPDRV